jgi:hypothetical protein
MLSNVTRNLTQKNTLRVTEQDRADIAAARTEWRDKQPELDPARLIFIDETWINQHDAADGPGGTRQAGRGRGALWALATSTLRFST